MISHAEVVQHTCYPRPVQQKFKKCRGDRDLAYAPPGIIPVPKFEYSRFRHPVLNSAWAMGGPRPAPSTQPRRGNHDKHMGWGSPALRPTLSLNIGRPWLLVDVCGGCGSPGGAWPCVPVPPCGVVWALAFLLLTRLDYSDVADTFAFWLLLARS